MTSTRALATRLLAWGVLAAAVLCGCAAPAGAQPGAPPDQAAAGDAASGHLDPVGQLPLWTVLPFVGILLSIALFPLLAPHFWHRHFPKVSFAWAAIFAVPFVIALGSAAVQSLLHILLADYVPFIILLWALFTISGGIVLEGDLRGTPAANVLVLSIGTLLASWIGTTGAAMLMIRPLMRANAWRQNKVHLICFFIFLVANIGGSLTPLGDPPLFLGFLHGVPFFWVTKGMIRETLLAAVILLAVFYLLDRRCYAAEPSKPVPAGKGGVALRGAHNGLFLAGVMAGVVFSGTAAAKGLGDVHVYGHVTLHAGNLIKDAVLIAMGVLSLVTTKQDLRKANGFSWGPIQEVAYLFFGIFVTIIPALAILQAGEHGALAGLVRAVREPAHYFWATGALSSFLDNAPTYLTFFNAALGQIGAPESHVAGMLGYANALGVAPSPEFVRILTAISAGAVFMGANTYIGNAPNFMVKSIAEEQGILMPSFFGYIVKYSLIYLIPTFVVTTLVFFL
ncbi:MAG TPA: sodium:proton antiporter [Candidatus Krumholzibacteria bacterium]|nr:sodium:proton antiporter [Candidatus Krumholzibacteria bacterium]HPD72188.1 sodium:proton antiporter [Candidatus Krumholzibacteria bacterium]HRY40880.1 sodium:proton antiporter [Candidatus Krumholzibacteria bacterium]